MNSKFLFLFPLLLHKLEAAYIVFDKDSDTSRLIEISCAYADNYHDFSQYYCGGTPAAEIYPNVTGFWTACHTNCQLVYNGGFLPKPSKLWIGTYIEGDVLIDVSGNTETAQGARNLGRFPAQEEPAWCYDEIDISALANDEISVLNLTVSSSSNGFVLLDKAIVDLGDAAIPPIAIDTESDEVQMHWNYNDCVYLNNYEDFWVYGCPMEPEVGSSDIGYWSPCNFASCKIRFSTSPSITPTSVSMRVYTAGGGGIGIAFPNGKVLQTFSNSNQFEGWLDFNIPLTPYNNSYEYDVVLLQHSGKIMLDTLSFNFNTTGNNNLDFQYPSCVRPSIPDRDDGGSASSITLSAATSALVLCRILFLLLTEHW